MQRIIIDTWIAARADRCFDAARDLDLHMRSAAHTNERAVAGRTSGLIELNEEVTWRARHLGVTQHFTARITGFDRPRWFQDTMQRGAFRSFVHDHFFVEERGGTTMKDVLVFAAPLGILGRIAETLVLHAYMTRFLTRRAQILKEIVEAGY
ncbi:MAG TPA: SRPBCC family protein [Thermoanaerobaculia bacterium]